MRVNSKDIIPLQFIQGGTHHNEEFLIPQDKPVLPWFKGSQGQKIGITLLPALHYLKPGKIIQELFQAVATGRNLQGNQVTDKDIPFFCPAGSYTERGNHKKQYIKQE